MKYIKAPFKLMFLLAISPLVFVLYPFFENELHRLRNELIDTYHAIIWWGDVPTIKYSNINVLGQGKFLTPSQSLKYFKKHRVIITHTCRVRVDGELKTYRFYSDDHIFGHNTVIDVCGFIPTTTRNFTDEEFQDTLVHWWHNITKKKIIDKVETIYNIRELLTLLDTLRENGDSL